MKDAIFDAAIRVLGERGMKGMTMDRVASAANIAKGSLYTYFRSKKDLLELVYAKMTDPIMEGLAEIVDSEKPAVEKLSAHLQMSLAHVARHVRVYEMIFRDDTGHGLLQSSERSSREAASQRLAEIFRQGITEGVFQPADPLMLARMFVGLCLGAFEGEPELERLDARNRLHQLIMRTFLNGIATEKGRIG